MFILNAVQPLQRGPLSRSCPENAAHLPDLYFVLKGN